MNRITFELGMKKILLFSFLLVFSSISLAQSFEGYRFSAWFAAAIPMQQLAAQEAILDGSKGFAEAGFETGISAEFFISKHWSMGMRGGYAVYPIDIDRYAKQIQVPPQGSYALSTTPYQNMHITGLIGYTIASKNEKFEFNPYISSGVGLFKTSKKEFSVLNQNEDVIFSFKNDEEISSSLLITPGVSFNFALLPFVYMRLFGEYNMADYRITENHFIFRQNTEPQIKSTVVGYYHRALHTGLALSLRF